MKLSFTTLGCPDWDLQKIISRAKEYGFDAVDFRGYNGEMDIYKLPEFSDDVTETIALFEENNLKVSCFSSSVRLLTSKRDQQEKNIEEVKNYSRMCRLFKTKYIRIFVGGLADQDIKEAVNLINKNLKELVEVIRGKDVKLLLETHDDWTDSEKMRLILAGADCEYSGVLWDIHHPYRMSDEDPQKTWDNLGDWIEYTHWKDSLLTPDDEQDFRYCLPGEGDIPLREIYQLLEENGYQGYYTLEWEKKWHPEIEKPEIAFPRFVEYMRELQN